jgi:pentatricopeptide repeat protein
MKLFKINPDIMTFNSLINGYSNICDFESVEIVFLKI